MVAPHASKGAGPMQGLGIANKQPGEAKNQTVPKSIEITIPNKEYIPNTKLFPDFRFFFTFKEHQPLCSSTCTIFLNQDQNKELVVKLGVETMSQNK